MSAHQKRFLMMHNNSVQKIQRQSGALTITPPQLINELGRNKVYIYIYKSTLFYYNYWNSLCQRAK
jgi:hypothetical protein